MSETSHQELGSVPETSLIALYARATESQRADALIKDEKAVDLVRRMNYDFDRVRQIPQTDGNKVVRILISREMDRYTRDFLARHPDAVVVQFGCGLDSRFERVAKRNGRVDWYDLDLPEVIALRRKFLGGEGGCYHLLSCSVFDDTWLETVSIHQQRPFLFLAETVFLYFDAEQVKSLILKLRDRFPGAELVFDAFSPFFIWVGNRQISLSKFSARFRWGIWRGQEIEGWGDRIRLLDEWGWIDRPEPRLARFGWMRHIPLLAGVTRIYHFQLGKAAR